MPCVWYHYQKSAKIEWEDWWAEVFQGVDPYKDAERVRQSEIYSFIKRFLPKEGIILEGGCGACGWVQALSGEGFLIFGIDFSGELLQAVHSANPDLPIIQGNVVHLPLQDNSLSGYLSFGVVEHFPEGPWQALKEAQRVLKPGGILLISVPYYNLIRRFYMPIYALLQRFKGNAVLRKLFRRPPRYAIFYQYGFGFREFKGILERCGFKLVAYTYYDFQYGLFRDSKWLRRALTDKAKEALVTLLSRLSPVICAHMVLFAAQKVDKQPFRLQRGIW